MQPSVTQIDIDCAQMQRIGSIGSGIDTYSGSLSSAASFSDLASASSLNELSSLDADSDSEDGELEQPAGRLGVLGGSGPEAGIYVATMLLNQHRERIGEQYRSDQDAPDVLLVSNPKMGGPHGPHDILVRGQEELFEPSKANRLWKGLTRSITDVERTNCSHFCVVCNQLHILEPEIRSYLSEMRYRTQFISIIETTSQAIKRLVDCSDSKWLPRTFILGTQPVMDYGRQDAVSPYSSVGNLVVVPEHTRKQLAELIVNVKAQGPTKEHKKEMRATMDSLVQEIVLPGSNKGSVVFCLCCTELPLLVDSFDKEASRLSGKHTDDSSELSFHLVDPSLELAKACLDSTHPV